MGTAIVNWFLYQIPWTVWAVLGLAAAVALLSWLHTVVGWRRAFEIVGGVAAALGGLVLLDRAGQKGYRARKLEEEKAQDAALKDYEAMKNEVANKPESQLDKQNHPWLKP